MRVVTAILVAAAGGLAAANQLEISGVALLAALGASIATAATRATRVTSWIPPAVIVSAMVAVILAGSLR